MNIFIHALLVVVVHLVNCSINVTRNVNDVIYDKKVGGRCYGVYKASFKSDLCKCLQHGRYTFYSKEGKEARCGDLTEKETGCLIGENPFQSIVTFTMTDGTCNSTTVTASFMWNLKSANNGTWTQLPGHADNFFVVEKGGKKNSYSLQMQGFKKQKNLMGQLIKLHFSCGKCLVIALNGTITYPFKLETLFPELYTTTTTAQPPPTTTTTAQPPTTTTTAQPPTTTTTTGQPPATTITLASTTTTIITTTTTTTEQPPPTTTTLASTTSPISATTTTTTTPAVTTPASTTTTKPTTSASSTTIKSLPTIPSSTATTTTSDSSTSTMKNVVNGNAKPSKDDNKVGVGIIAALAAVSVIVVVLVIVVVIMCRKRGKTKGPGKLQNGVGAYGHTKHEDIYLNPVDTLRSNSPNYQDPNILALDSSVRSDIGNPTYMEKQTAKSRPATDENEYSIVGEHVNTYSQLDYSRRSRNESVLSNTSTTDLISTDYTDETGPTYSMLASPSPGQDGVYAGLNPIVENYEELPSTLSGQDTYEGLTTSPTNNAKSVLNTTAEPLYTEAGQQENYAAISNSNNTIQLPPHENYEALDNRTRHSTTGVGQPTSYEAPPSDIYTPVDKTDTIERPQDNYEELNARTRLSDSTEKDGVINPIYESDNTNYYHTLERRKSKDVI